MEYYHDFIQWMFPLREPSRYNPGAPVLTDDDVRAFHDRPELRENLRRSFAAFLRFLGLEYVDGTVRATGSLRPKVFEIPNHNWLRITRVLLCLEDARPRRRVPGVLRVFEGRLRGREAGSRRQTFEYWRDAAEGVAR